MSASASRAQLLASPLPAPAPPEGATLTELSSEAADISPVVAGLQASASTAAGGASASAAEPVAAGRAAADASPKTAAQAFAEQTGATGATGAKAPATIASAATESGTSTQASKHAAAPAVAGRPGTVAATAQPAMPAQSPATAGSIGGAVVALVMVIGLILALGWIARRLPGFRGSGSTNALRVVSSLSLGPRERVVVVAVGETQLLIGVGAGGMRTLHTLDQPLPVAAPAATPAFAQLLAQHFGKKA